MSKLKLQLAANIIATVAYSIRNGGRVTIKVDDKTVIDTPVKDPQEAVKILVEHAKKPAMRMQDVLNNPEIVKQMFPNLPEDGHFTEFMQCMMALGLEPRQIPTFMSPLEYKGGGIDRHAMKVWTAVAEQLMDGDASVLLAEVKRTPPAKNLADEVINAVRTIIAHHEATDKEMNAAAETIGLDPEALEKLMTNLQTGSTNEVVQELIAEGWELPNQVAAAIDRKLKFSEQCNGLPTWRVVVKLAELIETNREHMKHILEDIEKEIMKNFKELLNKEFHIQ